MKKMQVIQILVIFSVFLVQCYSSVDAMQIHAVEDEDLEISRNEKQVSITLKSLFKDIINDNSLFKEIPDKINGQTKGEIEKLYLLGTSNVSLSTNIKDDDTGNVFTVKTPKIIVDILGRKFECPKIDDFAAFSEQNALDLKLVVDIQIKVGTQGEDVFDVFEKKVLTQSVPYYSSITSDNRLIVNFSFDPFEINPLCLKGEKLKDQTKKDKVDATITTYIKSTVKPNASVFQNYFIENKKIEVMSCK